jgi:CHAD domain-containing protein
MPAQGDRAALASPASGALEQSLRRALRNQKRAKKKLDSESIHDLRVALRRCRSLAEALSAMDPDPVWRRLRKACKTQQRGLSDLRDVQVMTDWVKRLRLRTGAAGAALGKSLEKQGRRALRTARRALESFPRKRWGRWLDRLPACVELIPASERRRAKIALNRLTEVRDLHQRWGANPNSEAWHRLRVAAKRFRYLVESFLPEQSETWQRELRRTQDLLGDGHDLDVLRERILQVSRKKSLPPKTLDRWLDRVDRERRRCTEAYVKFVSRAPRLRESSPKPLRTGHQTLWDSWQRDLAAMAGVNLPASARSSRSRATAGSLAKARANQYPGRQRRISSMS